jgi:hypothetical protein
MIALLISILTISNAYADLKVYDKDGVSLKLSGRIQPTFEWREFDNNTDKSSSDSYDFFVRRARLQTEAYFTNTPVPIYGKMELKLDNWLQENSDGSKKDPKVRLENAFVRFDPWEGQFRIEIGLEDSVFSRESRQSDSRSLFINESFIQSVLSGAKFADNAIGLHLKGKAMDKRLNLGLGIYEGETQGTDLESFESDTLQYALAVVYHILDIESGVAGSHVGDGKTYLTVGGYYASQDDRADNKTKGTETFDDTAYGFDVFGQFGDQAGPGTGTAHVGYFMRERDNKTSTDVDTDGWYLEGGYLLPMKVGIADFELTARYQELIPDNAADQEQITLGFNYYIMKHNIKVMANYEINEDSTKVVSGTTDTYDPGDTASVRVQLMF